MGAGESAKTNEGASEGVRTGAGGDDADGAEPAPPEQLPPALRVATALGRGTPARPSVAGGGRQRTMAGVGGWEPTPRQTRSS